MQPADDFQTVLPGLYFWQGYDPAVKAELSSAALRIGNRLVLIDPILLAEEPLELLVADARPCAIVLTSGNHERASAVYRKKFATPIFAHEEARGEFTGGIDHWIGEAVSLPHGLGAVRIPGAGPGEIAIYSGAGNGILMMGDALINMEPQGFTFLPDKYCCDPKRMRQSIRNLLQFSFEAMTFAHGLPVVSGAKQRLEQLLLKSGF